MSRRSVLPADREQWLHDQVYLTIVNDGDWYRKATASMPSFDRVRYVSNRWREDLCPKEDRQMSPEERRIVNMWLYEDLLGRPLTLADIPSADGYRDTFVRHIAPFRSTRYTPSTHEEIPMNPTPVNNSAVAFETRHFVYGTEVSSMSEAQLINAIKQIEAEIADLKAVKTKSSRITAKVKELEDMLAKVVEQLDKK